VSGLIESHGDRHHQDYGIADLPRVHIVAVDAGRPRTLREPGSAGEEACECFGLKMLIEHDGCWQPEQGTPTTL